jgi:hypothetical protein
VMDISIKRVHAHFLYDVIQQTKTMVNRIVHV